MTRLDVRAEVRARSLAYLFPLLVLGVWLSMAAPALAYFNETGTTDPNITQCIQCHGSDTASYQGPHSGYQSTSAKCATCHSVHTAPDSEKLLPGPTVQATCEACHDGTGGHGVYGVLTARGLAPVAQHRIDTTNVVPGGNASTGETSAITFTGENGRLSCDDCHSPHNASTVASFTGDRLRSAGGGTMIKTNRLLRKRPTGATQTVSVYGSDWCGGCHQGRLTSGIAGHNHPLDASATVGASTFYYERVSRVASENLVTTELGTLGSTNRGYVMPWPRTANQTGHSPICQQCHEDARSVGATGAVAFFRVTSPDGNSLTDNPRFQMFPHESQSAGFLLESGQDLCTNCHASGSQMP